MNDNKLLISELNKIIKKNSYNDSERKNDNENELLRTTEIALKEYKFGGNKYKKKEKNYKKIEKNDEVNIETEYINVIKKDLKTLEEAINKLKTIYNKGTKSIYLSPEAISKLKNMRYLISGLETKDYKKRNDKWHIFISFGNAFLSVLLIILFICKIKSEQELKSSIIPLILISCNLYILIKSILSFKNKDRYIIIENIFVNLLYMVIHFPNFYYCTVFINNLEGIKFIIVFLIIVFCLIMIVFNFIYYMYKEMNYNNSEILYPLLLVILLGFIPNDSINDISLATILGAALISPDSFKNFLKKFKVDGYNENIDEEQIDKLNFKIKSFLIICIVSFKIITMDRLYRLVCSYNYLKDLSNLLIIKDPIFIFIRRYLALGLVRYFFIAFIFILFSILYENLIKKDIKLYANNININK